MTKKLKVLTNKTFHDIIKTNNKEFVIESDSEFPSIGTEVRDWFKDYSVSFAGVGRSGLIVYNNNGLAWPLLINIRIKDKPKTKLGNMWTNFFEKWSI